MRLARIAFAAVAGLVLGAGCLYPKYTLEQSPGTGGSAGADNDAQAGPGLDAEAGTSTDAEAGDQDANVADSAESGVSDAADSGTEADAADGQGPGPWACAWDFLAHHVADDLSAEPDGQRSFDDVLVARYARSDHLFAVTRRAAVAGDAYSLCWYALPVLSGTATKVCRTSAFMSLIADRLDADRVAIVSVEADNGGKNQVVLRAVQTATGAVSYEQALATDDDMPSPGYFYHGGLVSNDATGDVYYAFTHVLSTSSTNEVWVGRYGASPVAPQKLVSEDDQVDEMHLARAGTKTVLGYRLATTKQVRTAVVADGDLESGALPSPVDFASPGEGPLMDLHGTAQGYLNAVRAVPAASPPEAFFGHIDALALTTLQPAGLSTGIALPPDTTLYGALARARFWQDEFAGAAPRGMGSSPSQALIFSWYHIDGSIRFSDQVGQASPNAQIIRASSGAYGDYNPILEVRFQVVWTERQSDPDGGGEYDALLYDTLTCHPAAN